MVFDFSNIGVQIEDGILYAASLLKTEGVPGYIAVALVILLSVCSIDFLRLMRARQKVLREIRRKVLAYADIPSFSVNFEEFRADIKSKAQELEIWQSVSDALDEYQETIVREIDDGTMTLRNAIRPGSFLNLEDLDFGPGVFRVVPALFVSLGLFFTFLGLVGALDGLGTDMAGGGSSQDAVIGLMSIASAKFITSLTGLGCSIIFNMLMRREVVALDREVHRLCHAIERRLSFVSLEDLGFRTLSAMDEQREHFRKIGMEMVAELSRPLREDLPAAISSSISTAMEPIFEKVGNIGASGMEGLVGNLSSQISGSVGNAITKASDALMEASGRINSLVDRMDDSSGKMGQGMETAVAEVARSVADLRMQLGATGEAASSAMTDGAERMLAAMNTTLEGIRDNTSEGARAMSAAAEEMRKSAEGFRSELEAAAKDGSAAVASRMERASTAASGSITAAGDAMLESFGAASARIAALGQDLTGSIDKDLTGKLNEIGTKLTEMASAIERGAGDMRSASGGLKGGADSIANAALSFDGASRALVTATEPVRASHERIEGAMRGLATSAEQAAQTVTESSERVAKDSADVLKTARVALGQEREAIDQSLEATRAALRQITDQSGKLEDIDEKLGTALEHYARTLEAALGTAQDHIREMQRVLEPGLDTLKSVVEQAESFVPQSRRA